MRKPTILVPTETRLYNHRRRLEVWNFGFTKKSKCTIRVAKTKALISFAVTAKLICAFVFAYANCWFSNAAAHIIVHFKEIKSEQNRSNTIFSVHLGRSLKNLAYRMVLINQRLEFER